MLLRRGSQGSEVEALQQQLAEAGYDVGVDGVFGPETQRAVREFQKDNGLSVDGVAGNNTFGALNDITTQTAANIDAAPSANVNAAPSEAQAEPYVVQQGDTLSSIAERELGDKSRFREIAELNGISNPNAIGVGKELAIPGRTAAVTAVDSKSPTPPQEQAASVTAGESHPSKEPNNARGGQIFGKTEINNFNGHSAEIGYGNFGPQGGYFFDLGHHDQQDVQGFILGGGGIVKLGDQLLGSGELRFGEEYGASAAASVSQYLGESNNTRLTGGLSYHNKGGVAYSGEIAHFTGNDKASGGLTLKGYHNPDGGLGRTVDGVFFDYVDDATVEKRFTASAEYDRAVGQGGEDTLHLRGFAEYNDRTTGEQTTFVSGQVAYTFGEVIANERDVTIGATASTFSLDNQDFSFKGQTLSLGAKAQVKEKANVFGAVAVDSNGNKGAAAGVEWDVGGERLPDGTKLYFAVGNDVFTAAPGTNPVPQLGVIEGRGTQIEIGATIGGNGGKPTAGTTTFNLQGPAADLVDDPYGVNNGGSDPWDPSTFRKGSSIGGLPPEFPKGILPESPQSIASLQEVLGGDHVTGTQPSPSGLPAVASPQKNAIT